MKLKKKMQNMSQIVRSSSEVYFASFQAPACHYNTRAIPDIIKEKM